MLSVFEQRNTRQFDANVRSVWVQARYLPVMEFVPVGWSCIALGFGGWLVARGDLTIGSLSAYLLYLQLTTDPIQSLGMLFNQATSDLDPGTELVATRALSELLADRTTIVIAHRLSTIWTPTGSRSSPKAGSANWARTRNWSRPAAAMPRYTPAGSAAPITSDDGVDRESSLDIPSGQAACCGL
jgi:hypothetical protein